MVMSVYVLYGCTVYVLYELYTVQLGTGVAGQCGSAVWLYGRPAQIVHARALHSNTSHRTAIQQTRIVTPPVYVHTAHTAHTPYSHTAHTPYISIHLPSDRGLQSWASIKKLLC